VTAELIVATAAAAAVWALTIWLLSLAVGRYCIVDAFWGPGFVVTGVAAAQARGWSDLSMAQLLLLGLVLIWAVRLAVHLGLRILRDPHEDRRYAAIRDGHQPGFWWKSLFLVFLLQAVILWFVGLPVVSALGSGADNRHWGFVVCGLLVWLTGLFFESVGDWQLARFRSSPENRGQVLQSGLWRLTRHPNYFGDFCVWWGLWLVAVGSGAPLWTVLSPLAMAFFLMRVSGVPMLERDISQRRPGYAEYVRRTNAFFPGPSRRSEPG
jgi:steroid 5-alpha reductase family enzyme